MSSDIGLFDLDGSLADYEYAMRRDLTSLIAPGEEMPADLWDDSLEYLVNRKRMISNQPGWWSSLLPIRRGFKILSLAKDLGFSIMILTKGPSKNSTAWKEKVDWCHSYITPAIGEDYKIQIVQEKGTTYGKFLYDDFPDYMTSWLEHRPRGLGIMPVNDTNKEFKHPNVIKYDENNYWEVANALIRVKAREPLRPIIR